MRYKFENFDVEVAVDQAGGRKVLVYFKDGKLALDASSLSVDGLRNVCAALQDAANLLFTELEFYYRKQKGG